jgi:acyl-CoA thioester hydrolase
MDPITPDNWNALPTFGATVVPSDWIDFMGHMNVMWYTHLFGKGILELLKAVGLTKEYFAENNAGSFVLEQHIRYLAEVRVGETVSLRVRALNRSEKKLHMMVYLIKEDTQNLAATSEIIVAHIDMSRRRTSPIPDSISQKIDQLLAEHNNLSWPSPMGDAVRRFMIV